LQLRCNKKKYRILCLSYKFQNCQVYTSNPLYNHTHFNPILVCGTHFLGSIHFSKKHHSLESLSHSFITQKYLVSFLCKYDYKGKNLKHFRVLKIVVPFGNFSVVQVVQTNKKWIELKRKEKQLSNAHKQKVCELAKKTEHLN
jgi:hypothetical protein